MIRRLSRWLKDPLIHFLGLGLVGFLLFDVFGHGAQSGSRDIVITRDRLRHLAVGFAQVRGRAPNEAEVKGLVADSVREEIAYREARALGLDVDDIVVRRRLRQKFEFLADDAGPDAAPTDAELTPYLHEHAAEFSGDARVAFRQVFLDRARGADRRAAPLLALLRSQGAAAPVERLGDPLALDSDIPLSDRREIARRFGDAFAKSVLAIPPGQWAGPIESSYGVHLVLITASQPAPLPELKEVRGLVLQKYLAERHERRLAERYSTLLRSYRVTVESTK